MDFFVFQFIFVSEDGHISACRKYVIVDYLYANQR